MKIKLKDILPNPYRDFGHCPIDQKKVNALIDSMKQTGFWDNVVVRSHPEIPGKYQQAYGHNRLTAVGIVFGSDYEVDLPVRDLSDEVMLQMMANENMEYWATSPTVIDETVRQAKKFLEDHPEVAGKYRKRVPIDTPIGMDTISEFLGWNREKVRYSLERLNLIDSGEVDAETIAMFDTEGSARTFVNTLKEYKEQNRPIPKEAHKDIVQRYRDSKNSKETLKNAVIDSVYETPKKSKKEIETEAIIKIEDELQEVNLQVEGFRDKIKRIQIIYDSIGGVPQEWSGFNWHAYLIDNLQRISGEIRDFINNCNNLKKLSE